MENSMVTAFTDRPMELSVVDAGKKASVCNGTTSRPLITSEPELKIIDNNLRTLNGNKILSFPVCLQNLPKIDEIDGGQTGFDE